MAYQIGEALDVLRTLESDRFQCCVTSPPYWGLRDYGRPEQLGHEPTPTAYVERLVAIMREVRRVLRPDGALWLNLGDSYASGEVGRHDGYNPTKARLGREAGIDGAGNSFGERQQRRLDSGVKPKDLVGIPWMVAFALRADGWYLRSDTIWAKPNPMPESVTDRPTKAHEYVFLLAKSERYFYDAQAIAEPSTHSEWPSVSGKAITGVRSVIGGGAPSSPSSGNTSRNARSVWTIASQPFAGAHFATMPPKLAERCILAGSRIGDEVLDPFLGSGTVGMVAESLGRRWFGIELQPAYEPLIKQRTAQMGILVAAAGALGGGR